MGFIEFLVSPLIFAALLLGKSNLEASRWLCRAGKRWPWVKFPDSPVNIPIPTKIASKMGGAPIPQNSTTGVDPRNSEANLASDGAPGSSDAHECEAFARLVLGHEMWVRHFLEHAPFREIRNAQLLEDSFLRPCHGFYRSWQKQWENEGKSLG